MGRNGDEENEMGEGAMEDTAFTVPLRLSFPSFFPNSSPMKVPYESQLPFETLSCLISVPIPAKCLHECPVLPYVTLSLASPQPTSLSVPTKGVTLQLCSPPSRANLPLPRAVRVHASYNSTSNLLMKGNAPASPTGDARLGKLFSVLPFY